MTHSGGMPHAIGDKGQQYEITVYSPYIGCRIVLGWTNFIENAERMKEGAKLQPSWEDPQITDRFAKEDNG